MDRHLRQHSEPVRDAVAAYVLATRRQFEDLRQVAAQLAGLLVLAASGSPSAGPHHPMLTSAAQIYNEAVEALHDAGVPPQARKHHLHLRNAAGALRTALLAAQTGIAIDPVLVPLRAAYDHLQLASTSLPGFPMVTFDLACFAQGRCAIKS
jgi:hypothetical protein